MTMLGFTAEASLSETRGHHRSGGDDDRTLVAVRPAQHVFTDSTTESPSSSSYHLFNGNVPVTRCIPSYVCTWIPLGNFSEKLRWCRFETVCF
jgi:hypothetical protein